MGFLSIHRLVIALSPRSNPYVLSARQSSSFCKYYSSKYRDRDYDRHKRYPSSYLKKFCGILLGAVCGYEVIQNVNFFKNNLPIIQAKAVPQRISRRNEYNFIADVIDMCAHSVVFIEIKDMNRRDYHTGKPITASNGSGFIIDSNGLILTNAHVVINKPQTAVKVRLFDGRIFSGIVEDVDESSDLATVRIQCDNLSVMKLGESASLRAGEWVVAMGSPLSLNNSVTAGVVSNTQRASQELGLRGSNINYIQTDAAITFGNSGGPLVNLDGEAIGVNSMKVTSGISFAIPIDYVKEFLVRSFERKKKGESKPEGCLVRRYIGITMLTLTPDILHEFKTRSSTIPEEIEHGVLVWKVIIQSPAHIGGLAPGDIITHINDKEVRNSIDIYDALAKNTRTLNMVVYRGLNKMKFTVIPEDP